MVECKWCWHLGSLLGQTPRQETLNYNHSNDSSSSVDEKSFIAVVNSSTEWHMQQNSCVICLATKNKTMRTKQKKKTHTNNYLHRCVDDFQDSFAIALFFGAKR